ncbi:DprA-like winged helix domain-containing protein [Caballeronia mineralivorans]|uniref:DprA-like winged helix domain-containing protein n=1 Tax=Caballeronia mineralivorans TaxID=2010198 RepID=UPI00136497AC|nr:hypothetical protein [Caballeronia mineralivorans]
MPGASPTRYRMRGWRWCRGLCSVSMAQRVGAGSRSEATENGEKHVQRRKPCADPATSEFARELDKTCQPRSQTPARCTRTLGHSPATLEILAERTEMDGATLQSLLQPELAGRIGALPGGRFTRLER